MKCLLRLCIIDISKWITLIERYSIMYYWVLVIYRKIGVNFIYLHIIIVKQLQKILCTDQIYHPSNFRKCLCR
jgi:hypothetical protein